MNIPFNTPYIVGTEHSYIAEALQNRHLSGDGKFTQKCHLWLEETLGCKKALLTQSCTAALEMAAILINTQPGDEIIMPSYTFVSTAMAFVLRGGVPVFVDIRADTLNMDENKIEAAITDKTKAIVVVHYAGVACEMDKIMALAKKYNLYVIEDAAQALMSSYGGKMLGSIGHLSTFSFHATKNIISGEGGALCINDPKLISRAEIIREKGTNRKQFIAGEVDKYSWVDIGSSYLPSETTAAFLYAQLQAAEMITFKRLALWSRYQSEMEILEFQKLAIRPIHPENCQHNAHLYYIILNNQDIRSKIMIYLKAKGIQTATHYVPLHDSIAGKKYGRSHGDLEVTVEYSSRILRLPMWIGVEEHQSYIVNSTVESVTALVAQHKINSLLSESGVNT